MDWVPVVAVVAILVGLPLLAVQVSRAKRWERLEAKVVTNPDYELARELNLSWQERTQVDTACSKGLALEDPRLRRAVVRQAQLALRPWDLRPRGVLSTLLLLLVVVFVVGTVATIVFSIVTGGFIVTVMFDLLIAWAFGWFGTRQRNRLRRAIQLNDDGAS